MGRSARSRYEGHKQLMKLEDEGRLSVFECLFLEALWNIRDNLGKPGMLEEKPKLKPKKK